MDAGDPWNGLLRGELESRPREAALKIKNPAASSIEVMGVAFEQLCQHLTILAPATNSLELFDPSLQLPGEVQTAIQGKEMPLTLA